MNLSWSRLAVDAPGDAFGCFLQIAEADMGERDLIGHPGGRVLLIGRLRHLEAVAVAPLQVSGPPQMNLSPGMFPGSIARAWPAGAAGSSNIARWRSTSPDPL